MRYLFIVLLFCISCSKDCKEKVAPSLELTEIETLRKKISGNWAMEVMGIENCSDCQPYSFIADSILYSAYGSTIYKKYKIITKDSIILENRYYEMQKKKFYFSANYLVLTIEKFKQFQFDDTLSTVKLIRKP